MIYLADTANLEKLKDLFHYFPIAGITTNPTIIGLENKPLSVNLAQLIDIVGDKMLHAQIISEKA